MTTPLINGINYDWNSIVLSLFSVPVTGIVAIDYVKKQAKTNNYGAGKKAVSRGYGREECSGSIELYIDVWKQIIAAAPNRNPLEIPMFNIPVVYGTSAATLTKDMLYACEFMEDPFSGKEGDTKLTVKIPLIIGGISR